MDTLRIPLLYIDRRDEIYKNFFRFRKYEALFFCHLHKIGRPWKVEVTPFPQFHLREDKSRASKVYINPSSKPFLEDSHCFFCGRFAGGASEDQQPPGRGLGIFQEK